MENKKKYIKILAIILLLIILFCVVIYCILSLKDKNDNSDTKDIKIEYSDKELTGEFNEYKAKIILSDENISIQGSGVSNNKNEIIIKSAGTYYVTGKISNGNIKVEAGKDDDVQLVLDNCSITSKDTAVINGVKSNVLTITLAENSKNIVTDSENYTVFTDTEKSEPDGTIFTKTDLVINGTGELTVNSNYLDGIVSKDGLKIINANININSKDDGIRGKDYVAINSVNIKIETQGKGIKSTNEDDEQLGYILIDSGDINILSTDDALHSNNKIDINNGNINLSSGDDGIHADTSIVINDGKINISKSYEGMESSYIEINGGNISLISSDDGINISGGADGSSIEERPGKNNFRETLDSDNKLVINNGTITIDSAGDGLDSNGSMYIYGGNITIKGPTSSGNSPLDFDGECLIEGGSLIAYGSSGMLEYPSNNSTQNVLVIRTNGNSGDNISLKDNKGNEVISLTSEKSYQVILISNENIKKDETYNLYINNENVETIQITQTITSNGINQNEFNQNGMMQKGGNPNELMQKEKMPNGEIPSGEMPQGRNGKTTRYESRWNSVKKYI